MGVHSQKWSNNLKSHTQRLTGTLSLPFPYRRRLEILFFLVSEKRLPRANLCSAIFLFGSFSYNTVCSSTQILTTVLWPLRPDSVSKKIIFNQYIFFRVLIITYSIVCVCDSSFGLNPGVLSEVNYIVKVTRATESTVRITWYSYLSFAVCSAANNVNCIVSYEWCFDY